MPDDSLACMLGRMEQKIEDIKADLKDIKEEQRQLASYINTQKIGVKVVVAIIVSIGSAFVYFKEHVEAIIFGKVPA